jgi:hypothetical protein
MSSNLVTAPALAPAISLLGTTATLADKGCENIQIKFAIEIGGRCDLVSGHWEYDRSGAGGVTQAACISCAVARRKK